MRMMGRTQADGRNVLDDDRVGLLLVKLAIPAFMGMFVMTLYNVVDSIFIGRFVGPLGIAGLSIVFPLQMFSMGVGAMFGMGGASLVSRMIGANRIDRAEHALGNAISPIIILSLIIMIMGLVNPDFWLRLMGASETILPYARDYMTIILYGMFFMTSAMSMNNLIRSEGNAVIPMLGMVIGAVSNIIMDTIFIIPMKMGIQGAALATVIAQIISVSFFLRYYLTGRSFLKIRPRNLLLNFGILKEIMAIGIASFARTLATSFSAIMVNRLLVTYGGDLGVSAYGIVNRLMMFAMMPAMVFGQGLQPVLGFNYGARRFDRALRAIKLAIIVSTVTSSVMFLILYFLPQPFIGIFTVDSALIDMGSYAAKRIFLALYLLGSLMVGSLVFQSIGAAKKAFITSLARPFLFLLPAVFILAQYMGLDGIFYAFPIADGCTFILTIFLLVPTIWDFIRMKNEGGGIEGPPPSMPRMDMMRPPGDF
jgi:putative MATE family efflux protein